MQTKLKIILLLVISLPITSFARYEISDGSVKALYHLEDTVDASGNGYNLTNTGSVTFTTGLFNNGANFGNSNTTKWLLNNSNLGINGSTTSLSIWVKVNTQPGTNQIFKLLNVRSGASDVGYALEYIDTAGTKKVVFNRERVCTSDNRVSYTQTLSTSTWYYLVGTYSSGLASLYFNGVLVATSSLSGNGSCNQDQVNISGANTGLQDLSSNIADEAFISNTALSTTTINALYNSGNGQEVCVTSGCAVDTSTLPAIIMSSSTDKIIYTWFQFKFMIALIGIFLLGIVVAMKYIRKL